MKYKSHNHRKYRLQYHIIFSTKYRKKILDDIRDPLFESFHRSETLGDYSGKWNIEKMNIDKDHIHFLISTQLEVPISSVIKIMKQTTTYDMYQKCFDYMTKFYWKKHSYGLVGSLFQLSEKYLRKLSYNISKIKDIVLYFYLKI